VKFIHGSHHQAQELVNNIRLAFGVKILEGRVKIRNSTASPINKKTVEFKSRVSCCFTNEEEEMLTSSFPEVYISVYYRAKLGHEVYTCSIYKRQKKRNNYTICYFNTTTQIKYFCEADNSNVALIEQFDVDHLRCFSHTDSGIVLKHIIPLIPSNKIHIIQLTQIRHKVNRVGDFLCLRPNEHEVNL